MLITWISKGLWADMIRKEGGTLDRVAMRSKFSPIPRPPSTILKMCVCVGWGGSHHFRTSGEIVESEYNLVSIQAKWYKEHLEKRFTIHDIWLIINHGSQRAQGRIWEIKELWEVWLKPHRHKLLGDVGWQGEKSLELFFKRFNLHKHERQAGVSLDNLLNGIIIVYFSRPVRPWNRPSSCVPLGLCTCCPTYKEGSYHTLQTHHPRRAIPHCSI